MSTSGRLSRSVCLSGSLVRYTSLASPSFWSAQMPYQLKSTSYQASPCRADVGGAWLLLCQPSPNDNSTTHQLFVERSRVLNRRVPHEGVAEFTSQVECRPITVRRNMPQRTKGIPPIAR